MDKLFEIHDDYLALVPMEFTRGLMEKIDWKSRLIAIKGPKGVGKSTLMQQYIKRHFAPGDRHVLYCSADTGYFATHTLAETASHFVKAGGTHLFIDEIHKYNNWSQEIKEIYDLHRGLHIIVSGSSLLQINDGKSDLSRRMVDYDMPRLSFREYLWFETGKTVSPVTLAELLEKPEETCSRIRSIWRPLEFFHRYLKEGYYPFFFDERPSYRRLVENTVNYIIETELPACRKLEVGNTRKVKALLQVISNLVPFHVDISKISRSIGIERVTTLKYLKYLEEAALISRLYATADTVSDLQKPEKILLDNPNLLYVLSNTTPEIGTVRECYFHNQLKGAGHILNDGGPHSGDFRIDGKFVIEVGGEEKGFRQIKDEACGFVAADGIESAVAHKIPLWAFGFLY